MLLLDFIGMTGLAPLIAFVAVIVMAYLLYRSTDKKREEGKEPHRRNPFDGGSVF